jgi:murein DD-endopeptidase MepM/ murein hydrolase activator NlpD
VLIGFWHLYAKNPIAINPRTGLPFAPGDIVYQGEIIAYTGKTGNCFGIPFYHLHLAVIDFKKIHQSDKYIDPQYYINGAVDWEGDMKVYNGRIINIKCHEE